MLTVCVPYGSELLPAALTDVNDSTLYEPTTTAVSARSMNGFCELPSGTVKIIRPPPPVNVLVCTLPTEVRVRKPKDVKPAIAESSSSRG